MDRRPIFRTAIVAAALACVELSSQVPTIETLRTGTAVISGQVVDAQSGEPLANVAVSLTAPRIFGVASATTDPSGNYRFASLAARDYHVQVMDPLYVQTCYGATDVFQRQCGSVTLLSDQHRTGIDFRLHLAAILRGRVVDQDGRGVSGANLRSTPAPSSPTRALPSGAMTTRDGTFEIRGLASGDIVLSLEMPVRVDAPRLPNVYYPGVFSAEDAQPVRVTAGLVTSGITFRYPKLADRSITARISAPATGATAIRAWLYRIEPRMARAIPLATDGGGTVRGLLEGRYFVAAQAQGESEALVAFEAADLFGDTAEVDLLLQEAGGITGRVVAERGGLPPLTDLRIAAKWTEDGEEVNPLALDEAEIGPDGTFRIDGLFGLRSVQLVGLPAEWRVQTIRHGRHEISTTGVTVTPGTTFDLVVTVGRR